MSKSLGHSQSSSEKKSQMNNISSYHKNKKKRKVTQNKQWEIIQIRNKQKQKTREKSMKQSCFFEKINKIGKLLAN